MSDDEGVHLSRRSVLAGTAALGLAGSSTAVAKQFGEGAVTDSDEDVPTEVESGGWPLPDHDNANSKFNSGTAVPTGTLNQLWYRNNINGEPVVVDDTMYLLDGNPVGATDGPSDPMKLLAVDTKTAAHRWEKELEKQSMYTLGVADGTVYAKQERKYSSDPEEREIRAFDAATGTELWSVEESGSNLKPTDDVVLYESSSGIVSRSATDGRVEWTHEPAESIRSSVVADESVYVARTDDTLEVLSLEDGEKESQQLLDTAEATLVAGGTTLYLRRPDSLSAIDLETGEAKWTNEFDRAITDQFEANELVASADTAYLARSKEGDEDDNHRNTIYAFDADTGNERWRTESAHGYYPFVGADNGLYTITSEDRLLVRRDRDSGEVLSERQVTKGFIDHLVVTGDAVYVTSNNGMEPNSAVHVYRADSESDSGEDDDSDDRQDDESSDETDGSDDSEDSDDSEESDDSNDDC